jgi:hypothetical protein
MTPEEAGKLNLESARDNGNRLAFPIESITPFHKGLTKREYFAGLAMQGMLSNPETYGDREIMMQVAVENADALLKELHSKK